MSRGTSSTKQRRSQVVDKRPNPMEARFTSQAMARWSRTITQTLLNFAPPTARTMREAVERFRLEEMHSVRESTRTLYETALIAIEREIGRRGVDGEFRGALLRWRDTLPKAVADMRCYLAGRVLNLCVRWRWRLTPHDCQGLCQIKTRTRTRIVTLPQRVELLAEVRRPTTARRRVCLDVIHLLLLTGWRPNEACSVARAWREQDEDEEGNVFDYVRFPQTKTTNEPQVRVLAPDAAAFLDSLPDDGPWYFMHRNGKTHVGLSSVENLFREIVAAKGWPRDLVPMSLRHTFATRGAQLKVNPAIVGALQGNTAKTQFLRYTHPQPADMHAAASEITSALLPPAKMQRAVAARTTKRKVRHG